MVLAIFCDILSAMGPHSRPFHLENTPPPTLHPYISASGVDKNYLKWRENQLAVDCAVGSLIAIK